MPAGEKWSLVVEWPKPLPGKSYNFERGDTPVFDGNGSVADLKIIVRPVK